MIFGSASSKRTLSATTGGATASWTFFSTSGSEARITTFFLATIGAGGGGVGFGSGLGSYLATVTGAGVVLPPKAKTMPTVA